MCEGARVGGRGGDNRCVRRCFRRCVTGGVRRCVMCWVGV